MAVQKLKPRVELIKARFGDDKDKVQKETSLLYEKAGVNPLAGCLPSLATIPIFIGLYRCAARLVKIGAGAGGWLLSGGFCCQRLRWLLWLLAEVA